MQSHLVLVGLSGTGKTSIGRRLGVLLGRPFIDADATIETRSGRTVREIFEEDGETTFRQIEAEVMSDLLAVDQPTVIASGGGAVNVEATRKLLSEPEVLVVWLTAPPEFLATRAVRKAHRPLLDDDPVAALTRLAAERAGFYEEVADVTVDVYPAYAAAEKRIAKDQIAKAIAAMVTA